MRRARVRKTDEGGGRGRREELEGGRSCERVQEPREEGETKRDVSEEMVVPRDCVHQHTVWMTRLYPLLYPLLYPCILLSMHR